MPMSKKKKKTNMGVYAIINKVNGKMYIGSSMNLKKRLAAHRGTLRRKTHHNKHLQNSYNKYGEKAFSVKILEYVSARNKSKIFNREQFYMDKYGVCDPSKGYNISLTALGGTSKRTKKQILSSVKKRMRMMGSRSGAYKIQSFNGEYYSLPYPSTSSQNSVSYRKKERVINILIKKYGNFCLDNWNDPEVERFLDDMSYYLCDNNKITEYQKYGILSKERELEFTQGSENYINFSDLNYSDQAYLGLTELDIDEHGEEIPYRAGEQSAFRWPPV